MSTYRYIIPKIAGSQLGSGEQPPPMEPEEFNESDSKGMQILQSKAHSKGLTIGSVWEPAGDGWEELPVYDYAWEVIGVQKDREAVGRVRRKAE